jgi:hypothetical protein
LPELRQRNFLQTTLQKFTGLKKQTTANTDSRNYGSGCLIQVVALVLLGLGGILFLGSCVGDEEGVVWAGIPIGLAIMGTGVYVFYKGYTVARK